MIVIKVRQIYNLGEDTLRCLNLLLRSLECVHLRERRTEGPSPRSGGDLSS